jgi:zinc/manganese transport system substrate-binding protein
MDGGSDPHAWQPSARDSEALFEADLIIANGFGLEEGLVGVPEQAEADGVTVFRATDHLADPLGLPGSGLGDAEGDDMASDPEAAAGHGLAAGDPHFWLDPLAMRDVVLALGPKMAEAGIDVTDRAALLAADLEALDAEIADVLEAVPDERRWLVSGHADLGYFADRYGFGIVGSVVPGLSTSEEPSARNVAELLEAIRASGATVIFSDVGTPQSVAEAVAAEAGATLVELHLAQVPESGDYADLLRDVASSIVEALAG